jgi:hypothetical protein|tara:strand:+ start:49724 stop:50128 length:405 start_codon:yes stop_codon:yes gene_type:complete
MHQDIFIIDPSKEPPEERTVTVYTIIGQEDYIEDGSELPCLSIDLDEANIDPYAHAMKIGGEAGCRFFVKQGPYGKLFNPLGFFSEGQESKVSRHRGHLEWKLKEVKEKVFNFYVNFLRTKNLSYIHNAERELL